MIYNELHVKLHVAFFEKKTTYAFRWEVYMISLNASIKNYSEALKQGEI